MTERPILFSAPMLRAIRDDSKTRTRRMVKTQLPFCQPHPGGGWIFTDAKLASEDVARYAIGAHGMLCPYGQPGDRLWVRETWAPVDYLVGSKLEDPVCVAFAADQTAWSSEFCACIGDRPPIMGSDETICYSPVVFARHWLL